MTKTIKKQRKTNKNTMNHKVMINSSTDQLNFYSFLSIFGCKEYRISPLPALKSFSKNTATV